MNVAGLARQYQGCMECCGYLDHLRHSSSLIYPLFSDIFSPASTPNTTGSILWSTPFPYSPCSSPSCPSCTAWGSLGLISTDEDSLLPQVPVDCCEHKEHQASSDLDLWLSGSGLCWAALRITPAGDTATHQTPGRSYTTLQGGEQKVDRGGWPEMHKKGELCGSDTFLGGTGIRRRGRCLYECFIKVVLYLMIRRCIYSASHFLQVSGLRWDEQFFNEKICEVQPRPDTRNHKVLYLALAVPLRAKIGKLSCSYFYLTISIFGLFLSCSVWQKASCL